MGQQQLMLTVMGVLLVMLLVLGGIQMFTSSAEQNNVDQTALEVLRIIDSAREHYARPKAMGGGGRSFTGFRISSALDTTENAYHTSVVTTAQYIILLSTCRVAEDAVVIAYVYPTTHNLYIDRQYRKLIGC